MTDKGVIIQCPFCGNEMVWQDEGQTEEYGIGGPDRVVLTYGCTKCGSSAEFIENESEDSYDFIDNEEED